MAKDHKPKSLQLVFEKQIYHYIFFVISIIVLYFLTYIDAVMQGSWLSVSTLIWYWISIAMPIIHQIYVGILWRLELHFKSLTTKWGYNGFVIFGVIFFIIFIGRFISITALALSNPNTLGVNVWITRIIAIILVIPIVYTTYSVKYYFGIKRALGADHFFEEYRTLPLVKKGIFKYTNNAMYVFGLLAFWIPGFITGSLAATIVAVFAHIGIWFHYYTTEKPDMNRIYG